MTPASSLCAQLWMPRPGLEQSINLLSPPIHPTLSKRMRVVLLADPNAAEPTAVAPTKYSISQSAVNSKLA